MDARPVSDSNCRTAWTSLAEARTVPLREDVRTSASSSRPLSRGIHRSDAADSVTRLELPGARGETEPRLAGRRDAPSSTPAARERKPPFGVPVLERIDSSVGGELARGPSRWRDRSPADCLDEACRIDVPP